jgi:PAS domain S-box-containing protein
MRAAGGPIGWTGRTAQYLGGVYFLIASLSAFLEAKAQGLTLEEAMERFYGRSQVYYRDLVGMVSEAIISIDERKRVLLWNRGAEKMLGYTWSEAAGCLVSVLLMPEGNKERLDQELQDLQRENIDPFAAKELEIEMRRRDGTLFPSETSLSMRRIGSGWIATLLVRDITERKRAEASLTQWNRELATISRIVTATATQLDWQTLLDRTLQGALEITGLEGGTLCLVNHRRGLLELASAINTSQEVLRDFQNQEIRIGECLCGMVARTGDPLILWDNASGSEFATREALRCEGIRFHAAFPLMVKGRCIGVLCVFARSDKKPDQRKLNLLQDLCGPIGLALENARLYGAEYKAREQVTHILESITDGFVAIDVEGRFTYINQKAKDLLNLSTQNLLGKSIWPLLPEQVSQQLRSSCEEAMAGQRQVRLEEYYVEWNRWFDIRIYPFQEGLTFYLNDVTERKRTEEALRESEEKYRTLVEQSLQGTFVIQNMRIVFANQAFAKMRRYTVEELYSHSPEEVINMIHPDDRKRVWSRYQERLEGKSLPPTYNELRAFRKDGSIGWVEYDAVLTQYGGRPAIQVSVVEITKRREAEKALRESEQRYRQLAESAQDFIFIFDKEGKVQYINSSGAKEFGCDPDHMLGKSVMDLFPPQTAKRQWDKLQEVIQSGHALPNSETKVIFPKREVWLNTSLIPLRTESGEVNQVLSIARDVTERKQAEETLRKSERLYRQLSEENARLLEQARQDAQTKTILLHEVNHRVKNNLASIIGLIQTQKRFRKKKDSPEFQSMCGDLAGRIQGLAMAHHLLSAAGWSSVKLTDLATEVIHSTLQLLPSDQHLSVHVSPSSIQVTSDQANALALVINELATNTIKHGQRGKQASSISIRVEEDDGQIVFEFRDNGPGYPESILNEEGYDVGLHLVTNLVRRDLRGKVMFRNERGAATQIQFGNRRG